MGQGLEIGWCFRPCGSEVGVNSDTDSSNNGEPGEREEVSDLTAIVR